MAAQWNYPFFSSARLLASFFLANEPLLLLVASLLLP